MHSGLNLNASINNFHLDYRNSLGAAGPGAGFNPGTVTVTYGAPHGKAGKIDFSAAAAFSGATGSSMGGAGAMGGPLKSSTSSTMNGTGPSGPNGGQNGPSATVTLHLSF
jgi:hypothetical protein